MRFRSNGHVLVRGVLSEEEAAAFRPHVTWARKAGVSGLWQRSAAVAKLVLSPRIGLVVARLLGVNSVRLYHDLAFYKAPGTPPTEWHQDCYYVPLNEQSFLTMWMPLAPLPDGRGLTFASGSHLAGCHERSGSGMTTNDEVAAGHWLQYSHLALRPGDATFHVGSVLHWGPGNASATVTRQVITAIYYADGLTVGKPRNATHEAEAREWFPGVEPGQPAVGPRTPLVYSRAANQEPRPATSPLSGSTD